MERVATIVAIPVISFLSLGFLLMLTSYGYWIIGFDVLIGIRNLIIGIRNGSLRIVNWLLPKKKEKFEAFYFILSCMDRSFNFHWPCRSTQKNCFLFICQDMTWLHSVNSTIAIVRASVSMSSVPLALPVLISIVLSTIVFSVLNMNVVAGACS